MSLQRPLLLEGEAGVGKTELAKALAGWTGGELIRLQCYEGIDVSQAVYDWDYARQLLHLRRRRGDRRGSTAHGRRPRGGALRRAVPHQAGAAPGDRAGRGPPPVLLIDEIDRADDEFEAYLLEVLSDYQITVPEIGVFRGRAGRRSWSSRRTAPATCTTR